MSKISYKKDKYSKTRGGHSRFLNISCHHCGKDILIYQKDGPGELKRMYLDRIILPENLVKLQDLPVKKIPDLICSRCRYVLAIPYIYPKEKRKAFRLFVGAVSKKVKGINKIKLNKKQFK